MHALDVEEKLLREFFSESGEVLDCVQYFRPSCSGFLSSKNSVQTMQYIHWFVQFPRCLLEPYFMSACSNRRWQPAFHPYPYGWLSSFTLLSPIILRSCSPQVSIGQLACTTPMYILHFSGPEEGSQQTRTVSASVWLHQLRIS